MKVQPINYSTNLFKNYAYKKTEPKEQVSFNAHINLYANADAIKGESAKRFETVIKRFQEKIEIRHPNELGTIVIEKANSPEKANLIVRKSLHSSPFFYNIKNSIEEISDALLGTYESLLEQENGMRPRIESDPISDFNTNYHTHLQ